LKRLKEAQKNRDIAGIDSATNDLNAAWQTASQEMYQAAGQPGGEAQPGSQAESGSDGGAQSKSKNDEVTDVDFEEVKDDK
jgi:molecular chaperone DnaK